MNCFFGFTYFSEPGKVYGDPITQLKKGKAKQIILFLYPYYGSLITNVMAGRGKEIFIYYYFY